MLGFTPPFIHLKIQRFRSAINILIQNTMAKAMDLIHHSPIESVSVPDSVTPMKNCRVAINIYGDTGGLTDP